MKLFLRAAFFVSIVCIFCGSCMVREMNHGKELTDDSFAKLELNKSTKEDVKEILGIPSGSSTFDDNVWYYINVKKQGVAAFKSKVAEHKTIQLKFKDDILTEINAYGDNKEKSLNFNKGKSAYEGGEKNIAQDFWHNLGRFRKGDKKSGKD